MTPAPANLPELQHRASVCAGCGQFDARAGLCRKAKAPVTQAVLDNRCPLGKFPANLDGYDPETDPQSPKAGGCCGGGYARP